MSDRPCDCSPDLSRRGFLHLSLGGALGLALSSPWSLSRALAGEGAASGIPGFGQAEHCVVLFLTGGPSQLETWDPKPGTAQGGPTQAIDTAVKGIQLAQGYPRLAEQMQHVSLIRGMSTKEGNHQRARYYLHTGYVPSGTVKHPDMGSLICQQKADPNFDLPSYVAIDGATPGAGVLGVSLAPFSIGDPTKPPANLDYARDVDAQRFARRRKLRAALGQGFAKSHPGPETQGHEDVYAKADTMMHSKRRAAFDLDQEPDAIRDAYGRNKFGQGCLMARRLIEQGVKVVEVQLGGWDTHKDNFNKTTELAATLDAGFATLIQDLEDRDLLSKTLIVCLGEFGRTPKINANEGRDHFPKAWSLALAGGPVQGGRVVGATSPDGMQVVERPTSTPELMATVFHALGLDRSQVNHTAQGRPIYLVDNEAKPVSELFVG